MLLDLTTLIAPGPRTPFVVLLGVDAYGWSFLTGSATAALTGVGIGGVVHLITRDRAVWWASLVSSVTFLLLSSAALCSLPIGLLLGALSFKNSYRDLGTVDGRDVVVQRFAGWDGDDQLDAGYRIGPFVSFGARGDVVVRRASADIHAWRFTVMTSPGRLLVAYRAGAGPHQAGLLTLPRSRP